MNSKTILLIDEHPIVLEALQSRLSSEPEFQVIARHTHSDRALFDIFELRPDFVMMDLEIPGRGAIEVADQIAARLPTTKTVFFTSYDTDIFIDVALRLGVAGFLLKNEPVDWVIEALRKISLDSNVYSDAVLNRVHFDRESKQYRVKTQSFFSGLTLRQIQVLRHLARGESVKEVAKCMMLSERAIESHKYRIMQKMGIHDRVVLTRFAIREGLMPA
ncbi:response regulator transcription factor [Planctomicrobium piriforme]|uniref:DNA-binding response regulator, NarL/FixJ family, contains REC and HTH domains n=1 Tax=Planctomicrobium piriforme TaxID=1576369 RepID=A0A1I3K4I2_9PLAN|nr:response regulator transcription factor [Planctomicrobium piriforme]SFI67336.1 DNA-binding response regulator, NarL/FixJ family, contains REC and HTH domains [Planctomicrobium piriforme]